mmetsp:Transcript_19367/g.40508  ORF Transcript_19367/g.40508 Transcript_19367/m.40508 type:complete len:292 (+) Transcript_19367:125-1000(+)
MASRTTIGTPKKRRGERTTFSCLPPQPRRRRWSMTPSQTLTATWQPSCSRIPSRCSTKMTRHRSWLCSVYRGTNLPMGRPTAGSYGYPTSSSHSKRTAKWVGPRCSSGRATRTRSGGTNTCWRISCLCTGGEWTIQTATSRAGWRLSTRRGLWSFSRVTMPYSRRSRATLAWRRPRSTARGSIRSSWANSGPQTGSRGSRRRRGAPTEMSFDASRRCPTKYLTRIMVADRGGGGGGGGVGANLVVVAVVVLGTNVGILVGIRTNPLSSVHKTAKKRFPIKGTQNGQTHATA